MHRPNNTGRHVYGRGQGDGQRGGDGRGTTGLNPGESRWEHPHNWGGQPPPNQWEGHPNGYQQYPQYYYPQPYYNPHQYWGARDVEGNGYGGIDTNSGGGYQEGGDIIGRWDHFKEEKEKEENEKKNEVTIDHADKKKEEATAEGSPKVEAKKEGAVAANEEVTDGTQTENGEEWEHPRKTVTAKTTSKTKSGAATTNPYAPLDETAQERKQGEGKSTEKSTVITPAKTEEGSQPEEEANKYPTWISRRVKTTAMETVEQKLREKSTEQITKEDFKDLEIQEAITLLISLAAYEAFNQPNRPQDMDLEVIAITAQFKKVEFLISPTGRIVGEAACGRDKDIPTNGSHRR